MDKKGLGMINICIPVLNNYGGLRKCVESINENKINCRIYVIDNGGSLQSSWQENMYVIKVISNIGVAASWNRFIRELPEIRLICNDDIIFEMGAIEKMVSEYDENNLIFPTGCEAVNAFSCFILPQKIIDVVGLFDENISPNYAYFEDNDYHRRLVLAGFGIKPCNSMVHHSGSITLKNYDTREMSNHHKKFKLARANYIRKWGGEPGNEVLTVPREL